MHTGVIHKFFHQRGFGFITPDDKSALPPDFVGPNVFIHIGAINRAGLEFVDVGDRVAFDIVTRRDGRKEAQNIRLIDAPAPAPVRYGG